jgi:hypothetical protein
MARDAARYFLEEVRGRLTVGVDGPAFTEADVASRLLGLAILVKEGDISLEQADQVLRSLGLEPPVCDGPNPVNAYWRIVAGAATLVAVCKPLSGGTGR